MSVSDRIQVGVVVALLLALVLLFLDQDRWALGVGFTAGLVLLGVILFGPRPQA